MNTVVIPLFKVQTPKTFKNLEGKIMERFGNPDAFAKAIGSDGSFVGSVIRGQISLTPKEKDAWASALNGSPSELFSATR